MDFALEYAEMMVDAKFEDLSPHTVEMTKRFMLDTLGVAIAGSSSDEVKGAAQLVREWGGREEGTLLVFGDKLPIPSAVFANSVMIHRVNICPSFHNLRRCDHANTNFTSTSSCFSVICCAKPTTTFCDGQCHSLSIIQCGG